MDGVLRLVTEHDDGTKTVEVMGTVGEISFDYDIDEEYKKRLHLPEKMEATAHLNLGKITKARRKVLYKAMGMLRPHTGRRGSRKR